MEIDIPPTLIASLKYKHLLLDTNVFRDAVSRSSEYLHFFNELKKNNVTLSTIDLVKYELLKGAATKIKYDAREVFINKIVDVIIPLSQDIFMLVYELIKDYGLNGASINITDRYLPVKIRHSVLLTK